jgi:hypothetical protein
LGDEELARLLYGLVNIITLGSAIGKIIVGDVVKLVLIEKLGCDNPWAVLNDLVYPFAMSHGLRALFGGHDSQAFALVCLVVTCNSDDKGGVGESLLGLLKLAHVTGKLSEAGENVEVI